MSNLLGWQMACRLFASGDRKVEYLYVADDLPNPEQVAMAYDKIVRLFAIGREQPGNEDAQVHRIELLITPETEGSER